MLGTSHEAGVLVTGEGEEGGRENGEGRERKGNEVLVSAPGGESQIKEQVEVTHRETPTPECHSGLGTVSTCAAFCVCVCVCVCVC